MSKKMVAKRKMVKGCDYADADEKFDKKRTEKDEKNMKTPGIASNLKKAQKEEGYSKAPQVKPQKKIAKPKSKSKIY